MTPADLDQRPRHHLDHRAVRAQPQHRRRRAGHPGGDQRRRRPAAEEPAEPADLPQGQPGRLADHGHRDQFRRLSADRRRRLRRHHPGAAALADRRRRAGRDQRRAEAGGAGPDRSGEARLGRASASRTCAPCSAPPRSTSPKGNFEGPNQSFTIYNNDQLLQAAEYLEHHPRLSQRLADPRPRCRHRDRRAGERAHRRLAERPAAASISRSSSSPAPTSSRPSERVEDALPRLRAAIPPGIDVKILIDRTQTIRASVADVQIDDADHHQPRRHGDLPLPAQLLGDDHPEHHRADVAASAPSPSCICSATASTTCR